MTNAGLGQNNFLYLPSKTMATDLFRLSRKTTFKLVFLSDSIFALQVMHYYKPKQKTQYQ